MARSSAGIRIAVLGTVCSALWLTAGPAQAGVGDVTDGVLGGAGGGAVGDTIADTVGGTVGDTVGDTVGNTVGDTVGNTVGDTVDTVDKVTDSADTVVKDTVRNVRNVTEQAKPSSPAASTGTGVQATQPDPASVQPRPEPVRVVPTGQHEPVAQADTAAQHSSKARAQRTVERRDTRDRTLAGTARKGSRATAPREEAHRTGMAHRTRVAVRGARQMPAPLALPADHPCASPSLAVQDLHRCARADMSLPGLGGFPMVLPPIGLALIGLGLLLVIRARRLLTPVAVTT